MTAPIDTERIEDPEVLAALEPDWLRLWTASATATPFQRPEWLLAWWTAFAPGHLAAVVVRRGGRLVGLAPLYREATPDGARLLPIGIAASDYLDILVDSSERDAALAALSDTIAAVSLWSELELGDLPPDAAALDLRFGPDLRDETVDHHACPSVDLTGPTDDDAMPLSVPAAWRRNLRRARRLAEESGGLEIRSFEQDPEGFLAILDRLHARRWQSRGEDGVLADARVRSFQRDALRRLAAAGLARLTVALIGGRPAGAYYGLADAGTTYAYLGGFDPDFAAASPGAILIADAMADAVRKGLGRFDFLRGREDYKYRWGARDRWSRRRVIRPARGAS